MEIKTTEQLPSFIKKRFVKDFKIPINVFDEPYFNYFIDLYDSHFQTKEKLELLYKSLIDCQSPDDFFEKGNQILTKTKNLIIGSKSYQEFNSSDLKEFEPKVKVSSQNIYIEKNIGKDLFSIDLSKANFNSFRTFGLQKELGIETYEDLIGKFTNDQYFMESKHIRQILFGDLNPSRQQKIQRFIISNLCQKLLDHGLKLSSASSDEIIIESQSSIENIKEILKDTPETMNFFRIERFNIEKINPEKDFYIKRSYDENNELKLEFKNAPSFLFPQIFKHYYNEPVNEYDLLFFHEGFLAQFKEELFPKNQLINKNKIK